MRFVTIMLNVMKMADIHACLTDIVVAPPFVYLDLVKASLTDRIEVSAQNSWIGKGGAFTGEIRLANFCLMSRTC